MLAIKSLATVVAAGAGLAVASSSMMPVQAFSLTNAQSSGFQKGNDFTNGSSNDAGMQLLNDNDIFGTGGGWNFDAKYEGDGSVEGDNALQFNVDGINNDSGTLSFGNDNFDFANNDLAISLKAGNGFNMYYVEAGSVSSGEEINWNTSDLSNKDLSHASVVVRDASKDQNNDDASQDIPEPATGMALGIVGLGAFAYKRKSQDASQ